MNMNYEQKYDKPIEAIKVLQETNPSDVGIQNWMSDNVPELRESEDEDKKIRKELINILRGKTCYTSGEDIDKYVAWLEKQGDTIPDECVFRPVAGCDIESAAEQAIKQQGALAKKVVLAFNGFYIPVNGKARDIIVNEYNSWLEKQGEQINLPQFTFGDVLVLERVMETTKEVREDKELYEQLLSLHFKVSTIYEFEKQGKQIHSNSEKIESGWTDEDEEAMQNCCGAIAAADYYTMEDKEKMKNWLISLKQRMQVKQ